MWQSTVHAGIRMTNTHSMDVLDKTESLSVQPRASSLRISAYYSEEM